MTSSIAYKTIANDPVITDKKPEYTLFQDSNRVYTSIEKYHYDMGYQDRTVVAGTTAGQTLTFNIGSGTVSNYVLEIGGAGSITYNVGEMAGCQMIKEYQFFAGGKQIGNTISGQALGDYLLLFNSQTDAKRALLRNMVDAGYGNIGTGTVLIPIAFIPGQNGVMGKASTPLNVDLLGKEGINIVIKLNAGNVVSVTNAFSYASARLHYRSYTVDDKLPMQLYKRIQMVDVDYLPLTSVSLTQNTLSSSIDIFGPIQPGKEYIAIILYIVSSANQTTNFKTFLGSEITQLLIKWNNNIFYEHYSTNQAQMLNLDKYGMNLIKTDFSSNSYIYVINCKSKLLSEDSYENIGSNGIKLYGLKPQAFIQTSASTGTFYVNVTYISKAQFQIHDNGKCDLVNSGF